MRLWHSARKQQWLKHVACLRRTPRAQAGITIVELVVVTVMIGFFTTLICTFTFGYWRYGAMLDADLTTLGTRLSAGDVLRDSIGSSSGLIMQNSIADSHVLNTDAGDISGTHWTVIHAMPGNKPIGNKNTTTPVIYYRRPAQNASGSFIMNGTQPYEDEYVLYLDGTSKTLKMRILANPSAVGNRVKSTCPQAATSTTCPADKTIAGDIASIDMRYFSRTGNLLDYTSITDPNTGNYAGPDFTAVEVVEFKLNLTKKPFLQTTNATNNSTIIRVALRNA
jgi:type II secretory pathway pseudopilin PulG